MQADTTTNAVTTTANETSTNPVITFAGKSYDQDQSINELLLEAVKKDKEKEIKKIENEFTKRKRDIFLDFKAKADQFEEFTIDDRSVIYRNELFENLKDRINEVVSPEKKRVSIKLSGDEIIKQLQNSTIAN